MMNHMAQHRAHQENRQLCTRANPPTRPEGRVACNGPHVHAHGCSLGNVEATDFDIGVGLVREHERSRRVEPETLLGHVLESQQGIDKMVLGITRLLPGEGVFLHDFLGETVGTLDAILENRLNHGGDLIFPNRPKRLNPLHGEELERAELPDLDIVRAVVGPDEVHPVLAEHVDLSRPVPVGQLLVVVLEDLLGQLGGVDHHAEVGPEVDGEYWAVDLGPLGEAVDEDGLEVVEVADDGEGPGAGGELEAEALEELVGGEDGEEGEDYEGKMSMKVNSRNEFTLPFILVSAVVALICAIGFCGEPAVALTETMKVGGLGGVSQNNPEIDSIARFAVKRHNEKQNSALEFVRVVNAKEQVVAGIMHHLTLEVTDGGRKKKYEAKVWVKSWESFKELQEFKPVDDSLSYASPGLGVGHGR
ncbi:cysteine protease inhibitor [Striga asiatica]|uniref:Cysteine proteinase inhibitor n=1 Tax=Striga asiatica TaxID=4170 RepID=A0A5A7R3A1_STRAF|nr:cysteine protease inhibitor [Striga asiatica]